MFQSKKVHPAFAVFSLLISISAFFTGLYLFVFPTDSINIVSLQRLILIGSISLVGMWMLAVAFKADRDHVWAERAWFFLFKNGRFTQTLSGLALAGFLLSGLIVCLPAYRFGNLQGYFLRVLPLLVWLTFVCLLTFLTERAETQGLRWQHVLTLVRAQKKIWGMALIVTAAFILIWLWIASTGFGISIYDDYWYGAGVPILGLQLALAFSIGIGLFFSEKFFHQMNFGAPTSSDGNQLQRGLKSAFRVNGLLIFFLIWGIAAFLWAREPLPSSYFATGPDLPTGEFFPFSDAATFDLGSQFALIGQGINNGLFFDRVLYMFFLLFLHVFVGQNYLQVVAVQAAIYAVFPAILYLLGKTLHSRSFGVILAALVILRGMNGIAASSMIDLANQKQMLTDFPVVIFAAWFALTAVKWVQNPNKNYIHALWAGGAVGLAVMLRTHALFLLVFALLLAVMIYWNQKLRGLLISVLLIAAMFAVTLPWGGYSGYSVFDVYMVRIRNVLQNRYPVTPTPAPQSHQPELYGVVFQNHQAAKVDLERGLQSAKQGSLKSVRHASVGLLMLNAHGRDEQQPSALMFITSHFFHNLITSVLILPTSLIFHDLHNTLQVVTPFWVLYWDGHMAGGAGFFLLLNLFLIALGISVSWRMHKLAGLIPLGVFLFYNLANAFALTSGGRYIVPVDWVALFYFALGWFQIMLWALTLLGLNADSALEKPAPILETAWSWKPLKQAPFVLLVFLSIGGLMPLADSVFPKLYAPRSPTEIVTVADQAGYLEQAGLNRAAIDALAAQFPAFRVLTGRALYPRYYIENRGEPKDRYPYGVLGFPRVAFTLIGADGLNYVLLPGKEIPYFPNASDVIVLGCQENDYLDALLVVVIEDQQVVYTRQPPAPLQCPLPQPVCDNNHVCQ